MSISVSNQRFPPSFENYRIHSALRYAETLNAAADRASRVSSHMQAIAGCKDTPVGRAQQCADFVDQWREETSRLDLDTWPNRMLPLRPICVAKGQKGDIPE
jgi:hypothetical protein